MSTKLIRPGLTAATRVGRALLAAGWRYDSTTPMADDTTMRTLLHPSGREITARTANGGEHTDLTMTGLSLEQVAGAITGAGLTGGPTECYCDNDSERCPRCNGHEHAPADCAAAKPEHYFARGWKGGPGECGAECGCGLTYDGFDTLGEPSELLERHIANPDPECLACRHPSSEHVEDHLGCRAENERFEICRCPFPQPAKPDYWETLADDLRQAADRVATLAGTAPTPARVDLSFLVSVSERDADRTMPVVDALASVFGGTASPDEQRIYQYAARLQLGAIHVHPYTYAPDPEQSEVERLRARVAELEAERTQAGAR